MASSIKNYDELIYFNNLARKKHNREYYEIISLRTKKREITVRHIGTGMEFDMPIETFLAKVADASTKTALRNPSRLASYKFGVDSDGKAVYEVILLIDGRYTIVLDDLDYKDRYSMIKAAEKEVSRIKFGNLMNIEYKLNSTGVGIDGIEFEFKVYGEYTMDVSAPSEREAMSEVEHHFYEIDFGGLRDIAFSYKSVKVKV